MPRMVDTRRRLRATLVVVLLVFGLFAGRLIQKQGIDADAYAATANKALTPKILPATRGSILDRNGVELATSVDELDITADPTRVGDRVGTASRLAPVLGIGTDDLVKKLTGTTRLAYLARNVPPDVAHKVTKLQTKPGLPGIYTIHTSRRVYPYGELASQLLGYLRPDGKPGAGFESSLNQKLSGKDGESTVERDPGGRTIPTGKDVVVPPVNGQDVQLTIDRDIQWEAQQAIVKAVPAAKATSGTVVVMDVKTGEVYAMASSPSFDPNHPLYTKAVLDNNVPNRAVAEAYEPGSTSKIMTAAAAIDEGVVTPSSRVTVPPTLPLAGINFHDHEAHPTEHLTFAGVIAQSSNIGTILTYLKLGQQGPQKLYSYLTKFGIGQATGLKAPGESMGVLPAPKDWSKTTAPTIAFGQGFSLTAIQATSMLATIANDGVRVSPQLVAGTRDASGAFTAAPSPARTQVVSPATARDVMAILEGVVNQGTGIQARIPGYRVAGKTGTADRANPTGPGYRGVTASFVGTAPADAPRLVVYVVLHDPKGAASFGGRLGGPVFKEVMSFALKSLGIPPTGSQPPTLRLSFDR